MSDEYITVSRLADAVSERFSDAITIVVYFDRFFESDFNRVNIPPLKITYIDKKKSFKVLDDLFPEMRYVSVPNFLFRNNKKRGLMKLLIEVKESKDKENRWSYHKTNIYPINNRKLHQALNPDFEQDFDEGTIALDFDPDQI